jgi:formylmethanofuran dehydrogenase subunit D
MPTQFILTPGRTARQGTTLNEGKYTDGYIDEITVMQMCEADMQRLGLQEGDRVRMWNDVGSVNVAIKASKGDELPAGMLFISYGDISCQLMGLDTHGSGMPDSKGLDVWVETV